MHPLSRRGFLAGSAGLLAACSAPGPAASPGGGPTPAGFPVTITNADRTLTFDRPPERIVSLYPSMTEVLLALGAQLVGQAGTSYSAPLPTYREQAAAVPVLSDSEATTEALLNARPTLVVADQEYHFDGKRLPRRDDLAAKGVRVYINRALYEPVKTRSTVPDSFGDLTDLGRVLGADQRAKELVDGFTAQLDEVRRKLGSRPALRTLLITSYDNAIYAHAGGLYGDVLARAGAQNLTAQEDLPPGEYYGQVPVEKLLAKNPDVVVYVFRDDIGKAGTEVRRVFAVTNAGRTGRFVPVAEASFGGGLRSAPAVADLARALHPDAFDG